MTYRIVHAVCYALSLLPFRVLYFLSDIGAIVLQYVVRYRRRTVRRNIETSFPEMSESDVRRIERRFYHWFADYVVESLKLLSISREELRRRFKVVGADEVEQRMAQGQNCAAMLGHYCNWEWLSCTGIAFSPERRIGLVYHPLRNTVFNRLFCDIRSSQPGGIVVPKRDILRVLSELKQEGLMSIFGYIADQGPKWENIHLWLTFFGKETPVFTGAERIMRKKNDAVFYVDMERPRRGYYTCTFRLMTVAPADQPEFELTKDFFRRLEATIRRDPAYYLWTHNRWKRTREEFDRRFQTVNGKVVPRHDDTTNEQPK